MIVRSLCILFVVSFVGVAWGFEPAKPFPKDILSARFEISPDTIGKMTEIPVGAHADNDIRVVFSGHQKGINASMLLGPIGVMAAAQANSSGGKKAKRALAIDANSGVLDLAERTLLESFEGISRFQFDDDAQAVFRVMPYVFIARNKKTDENKIYSMIMVELFADSDATKPVWRTRFYGEASGGILTDSLKDSEVLNTAFVQAFERAAWGVARVVSGDFEKYTPTAINAWMPCLKNDKLKLHCAILSEREGNRLLRLPFGKAFLLSGYTVLDRDHGRLESIKKFKDKYRSDFERP